MNHMTKLRLVILAALIGLSSLALADVVHLDDTIVTGSQCTGFDCVSGIAFGFDTLRLRENNTRILFDDTSSSASFPRRDWQLVANDSANGGGEYFAIEDFTGGTLPFQVEGQLPTGALYVGQAGTGFGTTMPELSLHARSDNAPGLRLEQDGTGGFRPQTWDLVGNETRFTLRDATSGRTPLSIRARAPSNSLEIGATGVVAIGGDLTVSGTVSQSSSQTVKHAIRPVDPQAVLDRVARLHIARWRYIRDPEQSEHLGPMAEDFHARFKLGKDDRHISTIDSSGVALAAIQALNDKLRTQNSKLEADNQALTERLARLEAVVDALSAGR